MTVNSRSRMIKAALPLLTATLLLLQPAPAPASPAGPAGSAGDAAPIHVGETLQARMPDGNPYDATVAFELVSPVTGPLTIDARSYDFDTFLVLSRVEPDGEPAVLRMDDDTGEATNARIVFDAETDARYRIEVQTEWPLYCGDEFDLAVSLGESPEAFRTIRYNDDCTTAAPYHEKVADRTSAMESPACRVRNLLAESFRQTPKYDWLAGHWAKGPLEYAEKAETAARESLEPGHPAALAAMLRLGHVLKKAGEKDRAASTLERAVEEAARRYGTAHMAYAEVVGKTGREPDAAAIAEKILGPDHLITAQWAFADHTEIPDEAKLRDIERWFSVMERRRGADHPLLARASNEVSYAYLLRGGYPQAIAMRKEAASLMERACGPDHWLTAEWMNKDANVLDLAGEVDRALRIRMEMVERLERAGDPVAAEYLGSLFWAFLELGDIDGAEEIIERGLHYAERRGMTEEAYRELAAVRFLRGHVHLARGEIEEARALLEGLLVTDLPTEKPQSYNILVGHAWAFIELGEYQKAREGLERALEIIDLAMKKMGLESHPQLAPALELLGHAFLELGEAEEARRHLERAAGIRAEYGRGMVSGVADPASSFHLARALAALGRSEEAFAAALEAESLGRDRLRLIAGGLPERLGLAHASRRLPALDLALSMLLAGRVPEAGAAERAWDALVRSRASVLDETAVRNHFLHASADPEIGRIMEELMAARGRLAHVALRGPTKGSPQAYRKGLIGLGRDVERVERALAERSGQFREHGRSMAVGLEEVRKALPEGDALVAYVRFDVPPIGPAAPGETPAREGETASSHYAAFFAGTPTGEVRFVPLSEAGKIEDAVEAWRRAVAKSGDRKGAHDARTMRAVRESGDELRRLVWDPVARHLGGSPRVFVVPAGALNLINLAALPDGKSGYLIESGSVIHYLSAERDLVPPASGIEPGRGLVAMGGPDFDAQSVFAALRREGAPAAPRSDDQQPPSAGTASTGSEASRPKGATASPVAVAKVAAPSARSEAATGPPGTVTAVTEPAGGAAGSPEAAATIASLGPFRGERSACSLFEGSTFERLDHATAEVEEVAALWKMKPGSPGDSSATSHAPASGRSRGDVTLLTGASASESAFKERVPGNRIVHVATHGFFLGGGCDSALERSRGFGAVTTSTIGPQVHGESPLILSGLALAGANHRDAAGPGEDDGILTAQEIAALDLSSVEWAVLSACDTGVGEIQAGEGVLGLRRAFQVAGAGTLIMSLWSVEDEATREWMKALYEGRLAKGLDTAEAVRHASLAVLNARRERGLPDHPFYWAGFVAAGDWR